MSEKLVTVTNMLPSSCPYAKGRLTFPASEVPAVKLRRLIDDGHLAYVDVDEEKKNITNKPSKK